jgi:hypothetical protein
MLNERPDTCCLYPEIVKRFGFSAKKLTSPSNKCVVLVRGAYFAVAGDVPDSERKW